MNANEDLDNLTLEKEFHNLGLSELYAQKSGLASRVQHLQNEISDLAFNNYRTYADAGRTAENCKQMFTEMSHFMTQAKHDLPALLRRLESFHDATSELQTEYNRLEELSSRTSPIWEILSLPKMMEKCVRAGQYEAAYALTNFALTLKQSKLVQNPLIKVNNIRKIPYISNTQLRVSILQYRDLYLEKNVNAAMSEPEFVLRVIDVYRDCMYDTMVLYLAVFPDSDPQRRYTTSEDPRWERWTGSSQNYLLQSWAHRNVERLFDLIRTSDSRSAMSIESMIGKLMSFAASFGRMGMDFRSLVVDEFSKIVIDAATKRIKAAAHRLTAQKKLVLMDGDIFESTRQDIEGKSLQLEVDFLSAPIELCVWDDICVFGNEIIEALNDMRHYLSPAYLNETFDLIKSAMQEVLKWVDSFLHTEDAEVANRAARILLIHFIPFINKCFFSHFSYDASVRSQFRSNEVAARDGYEKRYRLAGVDLFAACEHEDFLQAITSEPEVHHSSEQHHHDADEHQTSPADEVPAANPLGSVSHESHTSEHSTQAASDAEESAPEDFTASTDADSAKKNDNESERHLA
ncbi:Conserved oligomeric Golgi complex component 8 [Aphelenchoides avenae]|nr:Conserved oligomeric Golgi complex component 8 [Aphelenchus avenae]